MNLGGNGVDNMQAGDLSEEDDNDNDDDSNRSEQGAHQQQGQQQQHHSGGRKTGSFSNATPSANEEDSGMEMDDTSYRIDGNARPMKRTTRR